MVQLHLRHDFLNPYPSHPFCTVPQVRNTLRITARSVYTRRESEEDLGLEFEQCQQTARVPFYFALLLGLIWPVFKNYTLRKTFWEAVDGGGRFCCSAFFAPKFLPFIASSAR